jgi:hypothetical protein
MRNFATGCQCILCPSIQAVIDMIHSSLMSQRTVSREPESGCPGGQHLSKILIH